MKKLWKSLLTMGGFLLLSALFITACTFKGCTPGSGGEGDTTTMTGGGDPTALGPTNTDGALTVLVPGGTFWMGSEDGDVLASADEKPRHEVTLSAYYIYRDEVTNAMYAQCVAAGACTPVASFDTGPISQTEGMEYADHPVVGVDWNMANDYCSWANGHLPTEAQWEFASRGLDSLVYPWGSEAPGCDRANGLNCMSPGDGIDTLAVGQMANGNSPFGIGDMSGNVWEWVQDWYDEGFYSLSPASNPVGPSSGEVKVARGGGWESDDIQMRSAERAGSDPSRSYQDVGFRCVASELELPQGYSTPPDSHTIPGAPDDLGNPDPGEWYKFGPVVISCPDQNNNMHIDMGADAYQPMGYSVFVNGNPYTCTYNDSIHILSCDGPIPPNNDQLTYYDLEVHFGNNGPILHTAPSRPQNCGVQNTITWWAGFNCFGNELSVQINYDTPGAKVTYANVAWVNPLTCIEAMPGVSMCTGAIDGQPGEWKTINFGLDNGFEPTMNAFIPVCAGDGTQFGYVPVFTCNGGAPAVAIQYVLPGVGLVSANVEGNPMNCGILGEGNYLCGPVIGGAPGELKTINFCLDNLECWSGDDVVLDCADPTVGEWNLHEMGCNSEIKIYFIMDTGLDWLVPGAQVTITADDEVTTYACVIDAMTPGRVVCSGARPVAPGMLKFCLQRPGDAVPTCTWISNWPWIAAGLPTCNEPEAEPEPVTPACSSYSTQGPCESAGCKWTGGGLAPAYCTNP